MYPRAIGELRLNLAQKCPALTLLGSRQSVKTTLVRQLEIKSSQTFHAEFLKQIQYFRDLVGARCVNGAVVYAGTPQASVGDMSLLNYAQSGSLTPNP